MGKKPFIDKKKARHFHLVHRSQRDPLAADPTATQMVLQEVGPNGEPREVEEEDEFFDSGEESELGDSGDSGEEQRVGDEDEDEDEEDRLGQAALFGIDFEDQNEYDYLQHMKEVGRSAAAVWIEAKPNAAASSKKNASSKQSAIPGITFSDDLPKEESAPTNKRSVRFQLPEDALPSRTEIDLDVLQRDRAREGMVDLDPRVLEALEALDDDAYVEEFDEQDFFGDLVLGEGNAGGEIGYDGMRGEDDEESSEGDYDSEQLDSDAESDPGYRKMGSRRSVAPSTAFSMTSSAMFRNHGLTLLDDRFDKIMEEYDDSDIGELEGEDPEVNGEQTLEQLGHVLDDFLENTNVVGRKLVHRLADGCEGVDELRAELRDMLVLTDRDRYVEEGVVIPDRDLPQPMLLNQRELEQDRWDCQTILTTHSNLENRPRVLSERKLPRQTGGRIQLSHKTGLPLGVLRPRQESMLPTVPEQKEEQEEGEQEEEDEIPLNLGQARPQQETAEEKRQRKELVKLHKKQRRAEKKCTKQAFQAEKERLLQASKANASGQRLSSTVVRIH